MHCDKCGQDYLEGTHHECLTIDPKRSQLERKFTIPAISTSMNISKELTGIPLSSDAPTDLTIEDILSRANKPAGLVRELAKILNTWKGFLKKPDKGNIRLLVIGLAMFVLWFWTKYYAGGSSVYYMAIPGVRGLLAVLLGSYNNVPARVLHFSSLVTLAWAFLPAAMGGQSMGFMKKVKSSVDLGLKVKSYGPGKEWYAVLSALGAGLYLSNYLMRNNSINKYAVCLSLGMTVLLSTSGLSNATAVRLVRGALADITRLTKTDQLYNRYKTMIQLGFGLGLVGSVAVSLFRSMSGGMLADSLGYYLGGIAFVSGIVLGVLSRRKGTGKSGGDTDA